MGLELLLLQGEGIHFVKDLLLLLGKSANIINQLLQGIGCSIAGGCSRAGG